MHALPLQHGAPPAVQAEREGCFTRDGQKQDFFCDAVDRGVFRSC